MNKQSIAIIAFMAFGLIVGHLVRNSLHDGYREALAAYEEEMKAYPINSRNGSPALTDFLGHHGNLRALYWMEALPLHLTQEALAEAYCLVLRSFPSETDPRKSTIMLPEMLQN